MHKLAIIYLSILIFSLTQASSQEMITIGEKQHLYSEVLGEEREYWVYLPKGYEASGYAPAKYPVIYFLDGNRHFHSLTGIQEFLSEGPYASLPEAILVGILNTDRTRDLTPTSVEPDPNEKFGFHGGGGNDRFLTFLKTELMPEIATNYRTNGYRTLIGHSFGGLTVLNTLLTQPEIFNSYIAIDPSVWWDHFYIAQKAKAELANLDLTGKTLYLAQANKHVLRKDTTTDHERGIVMFKELLEQKLNPQLRWRYSFYEADDHGTISLPAEYDGMRFIYEGFQTEVKLIPENPDLLIENYQRLSTQLGFDIKPQEWLVDWLADYALKIDQKEGAASLYQLNTQLYPESTSALEKKESHRQNE